MKMAKLVHSIKNYRCTSNAKINHRLALYFNWLIAQPWSYLMKLISLFLTTLISITALAKQCETIRVGCANAWYPIAYILPADKEKAGGIAVETIRRAAQSLGISASFNCHIPWTRAMKYMDTGEIDMIAGHYLTEYRQKNWAVTTPLLADDIRAIYTDKNLDILTLEQLTSLTGVIPRGASYGREIDTFLKEGIARKKVAQVDKNMAVFRMLQRNRVDYGIISIKDAKEHIKQLGLKDSIYLSSSLGLNTIHVSFSKKSHCAVHLEKFNQLIKTYHQNGLIERFLKQAEQSYIVNE